MQKGAANLSLWEAFCHHAKLGKQEEFQLNWLHQAESSNIVSDAFEQAKGVKFHRLKTLIIEENLGWLLERTDMAKIIKFIITNFESMNIKFKVDSEEWDGNDTFIKACRRGESELVKV